MPKIISTKLPIYQEYTIDSSLKEQIEINHNFYDVFIRIWPTINMLGWNRYSGDLCGEIYYGRICDNFQWYPHSAHSAHPADKSTVGWIRMFFLPTKL